MSRGRSCKDKEFVKIFNERIEDIGKCELCGSKKGLELHHIVPVVCGGESIDGNLILLCEKCHYMLTPKSTLAKIGIRNVKIRNLAMDFYSMAYSMNEEETISCYDLFYCFDEIYKKLLDITKLTTS